MKLYHQHQYIERHTSRVKTEHLMGDRLINAIFSEYRENGRSLFDILVSKRFSKFLGFINFDIHLGTKIERSSAFIRKLGIDMGECVDSSDTLDTPRKIFERKIRYWETRPMPESIHDVVAPSDAKMLAISLKETSSIFIKEKFFHPNELLHENKTKWIDCFREGDAAVFRLTPDKYHYNHTPVAGRVIDAYEIPGVYYPCNPGAVTRVMTPYSKNRRVVTILDTDVQGGTGAGIVAMVEVVALMIGDIRQCYSIERYDDPKPVAAGMFLEKGRPKSLFRPGSSTVVLLFQPNRVSFSFDIVMNMHRAGVDSRFSTGFGRPLIETEVMVRSQIGYAYQQPNERIN